MLQKENDNVLYLCTDWNKNSCAFGETTTQGENRLPMKEDALTAMAEFWPRRLNRLSSIYIILGYAYTSLGKMFYQFRDNILVTSIETQICK